VAGAAGAGGVGLRGPAGPALCNNDRAMRPELTTIVPAIAFGLVAWLNDPGLPRVGVPKTHYHE